MKYKREELFSIVLQVVTIIKKIDIEIFKSNQIIAERKRKSSEITSFQDWENRGDILHL